MTLERETGLIESLFGMRQKTIMNTFGKATHTNATVKSDEKETEAVTPSDVYHPAHYNHGIECWDYVVSHEMDFCSGNAIKYVTRHLAKADSSAQVKDLQKAIAYLHKRIEFIQALDEAQCR